MTSPSRPVALTRHAVRECLADLAPGELALVACSGGADSLALAVATRFHGTRSGLRVGAVTVDHGLQAGSTDRAAELAATLRELGLDPVEVAEVEVGAGGGPEDAARRARYAALGEAAERLGAAAVVLGHTREDQAETVLLRLSRGAGARSLAGMPRVQGLYRRPFLGLARDDVRAAARESGLVAWEDPHNHDPAFARSRVRHDVLPVLVGALGPAVVASLARTAELLRADADALDAWAADRLVAMAGPDGLDVAQLAELPEAVRTRVLRAAAIAAGCPPGALTAGHVRTLDALVVDWHGQGPGALPGGVWARRDCGRLLLGRDRRATSTEQS